MKKLLVFLITGLFLVGCSHNTGFKLSESTSCSVTKSDNTAECRYQYGYYLDGDIYVITHAFSLSVTGPELNHYEVSVPDCFEEDCKYVGGEIHCSFYSYETTDNLELFEATNTKALLVPVYASEVTYARK